jgi:hypothetical protein
MIERGPKQGFLARKFAGSSDFPAFIANHRQPKNERAGSVTHSSIKRGDRHFVTVVIQAKVFFLEILRRQPGIGVLTDNIDEDQGAFNPDGRLCENRLLRLLRKTA